jgi:Plasmid pRiA4b ORF-3-like protein/Helix-turn-helix domain
MRDDKMTGEYFQFRIALLGVLPMIWRRIQVPADYSFWDLHVAIQDSMGWTDSHLHCFRIVNMKTKRQETIGIPADEDPGTEPGWELGLRDWFDEFYNPIAVYEYDFGDSWIHEVVLEDRGQRAIGELPLCVCGERSCPPEDVGGVHGYAGFLEAIEDRQHPEHDQMLEWVGGPFDPEEFRAESVGFDDPRQRWDQAFEDEAFDHDAFEDEGEDLEWLGTIGPTTILSDEQVLVVARLLMRDPVLSGIEGLVDINIEDSIRCRPLGAKCAEAREKMGLSIKEVSKRTKVPQYRLKDIESGRIRAPLPEAVKKYTSFLGLDSWVNEWVSANRELARRLELSDEEADS